MGTLSIARVYDPVAGTRFLVDRLWPRGVRKDELGLAGWLKDLTPSTQLRRQFHAGTLTWEQFGDAYRAELDARDVDATLASLRSALSAGDVVLLFAGKDTGRTHAKILLDWLTPRLS